MYQFTSSSQQSEVMGIITNLLYRRRNWGTEKCSTQYFAQLVNVRARVWAQPVHTEPHYSVSWRVWRKHKNMRFLPKSPHSVSGVGWLMLPKVVFVLNSKTWIYVPLHGNRDIANVTKLRILRWGDYSRFSWWPKIITTVLIRGRQEYQSLREKM